jgi:hypothetical protein
MTTFLLSLRNPQASPDFVEFLVLFGGVATVCGLVIAFTYRYRQSAERKRTERLGAVGRDLDFQFIPDGDPNLLESLCGFQIRTDSAGGVKELREAAIKNLLRSRTEKLEVAVFDFSFSAGKSTIAHSVIMFRIPGASFPNFVMEPKELVRKMLWSWLGLQNIHFADSLGFSSKYMLRGNVEQAVRQFFNVATRDYFARTNGMRMEGCGHTLLLYRWGVRIKPNEVREFLEDGWRLLSLFHSET